jgi:polar amino acid transport system substrate-binding protein
MPPIAFEFAEFASCLKKVKYGEVDAVLDVAYLPQRADYIAYPAGTASIQDNIRDPKQKRLFEKYSIATMEYVVITSATNTEYQFNGDPQTLPNPVRIVKDYAIGQYLRTFVNLTPYESKSSADNFENLASTNLGCVIDLRSIASKMEQDLKMQGQWVVHNEIVYRENLYLGFSKKSKVPKNLQQDIWDKIEDIKNDGSLMRGYFSKY